MATAALSTKAVGSIIKLNVNGTATEFLVVHQGKPSSLYDDSCNGTWLLMKDCYTQMYWDDVNCVNAYANSPVHTYLNNTFFGLLDADIQNAVKQIKLPYCVGNGDTTIKSGANGLDTKVFLLGGYEIGWTQDNTSTNLPIDGAKLDYFTEGSGEDVWAEKIANYDGSAAYWWLRSPYTDNTVLAWLVSDYGDWGYYDVDYDSYGIRPALVLPSSLLVSDEGGIVTNNAPTITSTSGASGVNLGTKNAVFNFKYTVADEDGDTLTVTEKLDGVTMRTIQSVASGTTYTFEAASDADAFQKILNGAHTITIEVSDGTATTTFTATFNKAVYSASITMQTPLEVEGDISVAIMSVVGSIPEDANYKVEVTNNANDSAPVWQDVTEEVKNGDNIIFSNSVCTNGAAFNFRITVSRGASNTGGYISGVSGAFQ